MKKQVKTEEQGTMTTEEQIQAMKRKVYTEVCNLETWEIDKTLPEFLSWLHESIDTIPVEFRKDTRICIGGYEESEISVVIFYTRLETDEEELNRAMMDARKEDTWLSNVVRDEKATLKRLKAKYPELL